MGKRLVVCCDGTWNNPDEIRAGRVCPTNVAKLADGVDVSEPDRQRLFYEPGVGTAPDEHLLGGAFGVGLSANVRNAYRFIVANYAPGDDIYLFGFSRGAYTARSVAGLIRNCGILRPEHIARVEEAFALYRDRTDRTHPTALSAHLFRSMYAQPDDAIHFIGVWDTVGALGVPDDLPGWKEISRCTPEWQRLWGFHDTQLSSRVRHAYHALSIDEERLPFRPTLWTGTPAPGQTVEQVWFAGVHSEVGGGSRDSGLSDIALLYMVQRAAACGVAFAPGRLEPGDADSVGNRIAPDPAAAIVNSRHGFYEALRAYHRLEHIGFADGPGQAVANSVLARLAHPACAYRPPGIQALRRDAPVVEVIPEVGTAAPA
jgi:uncharacterized protein (DUF2235 family)